MSWFTRVRQSIPFLPKRETPDNLWHKVPQLRFDDLHEGVAGQRFRLPELRSS
jgi:hypothetical protein